MREYDFDPHRVWDEYDWERFLQQQDRNTEKYFGLLEQYIDHPDRDEIIAREMGWEHYNEDESEIEISIEFQEDSSPSGNSKFEELAHLPAYQETVHLHNAISAWLEKVPEWKDHPEVLRLATCSAVCGAKLAAALCGDEDAEIGMTIAYLKRSLKAANDSLNAIAHLTRLKLLTSRQKGIFSRRVFCIRNRVVELIGSYRAEWRRRYGKL